MAGEQNSNKSSKESHSSGADDGSQSRRPVQPHRESGVIRKADTDVPGEIMTRSEVAELLRCSEPHVVALIEREALPAFRLGKLWRFRRSEVLAWCERRENGSRTA
jgi:excisionase family DNA binding protein